MTEGQSGKGGAGAAGLDFETLAKHFAYPIIDAARQLGVTPVTLKHVCKLHGIDRWPFRKVQAGKIDLKDIQSGDLSGLKDDSDSRKRRKKKEPDADDTSGSGGGGSGSGGGGGGGMSASDWSGGVFGSFGGEGGSSGNQMMDTTSLSPSVGSMQMGIMGMRPVASPGPSMGSIDGGRMSVPGMLPLPGMAGGSGNPEEWVQPQMGGMVGAAAGGAGAGGMLLSQDQRMQVQKQARLNQQAEQEDLHRRRDLKAQQLQQQMGIGGGGGGGGGGGSGGSGGGEGGGGGGGGGGIEGDGGGGSGPPPGMFPGGYSGGAIPPPQGFGPVGGMQVAPPTVPGGSSMPRYPGGADAVTMGPGGPMMPGYGRGPPPPGMLPLGTGPDGQPPVPGGPNAPHHEMLRIRQAQQQQVEMQYRAQQQARMSADLGMRQQQMMAVRQQEEAMRRGQMMGGEGPGPSGSQPMPMMGSQGYMMQPNPQCGPPQIVYVAGPPPPGGGVMMPMYGRPGGPTPPQMAAGPGKGPGGGNGSGIRPVVGTVGGELDQLLAEGGADGADGAAVEDQLLKMLQQEEEGDGDDEDQSVAGADALAKRKSGRPKRKRARNPSSMEGITPDMLTPTGRIKKSAKQRKAMEQAEAAVARNNEGGGVGGPVGSMMMPSLMGPGGMPQMGGMMVPPGMMHHLMAGGAVPGHMARMVPPGMPGPMHDGGRGGEGGPPPGALLTKVPLVPEGMNIHVGRTGPNEAVEVKEPRVAGEKAGGGKARKGAGGGGGPGGAIMGHRLPSDVRSRPPRVDLAPDAAAAAGAEIEEGPQGQGKKAMLDWVFQGHMPQRWQEVEQ